MNCKPGDLAYIVRSEIPENIGAVVEVLRIASEWAWEQDDHVWWVRSPATTLHTDGSVGRDGVVHDVNLRPISGVPVHDEVTDEVSA